MLVWVWVTIMGFNKQDEPCVLFLWMGLLVLVIYCVPHSSLAIVNWVTEAWVSS